MNYLSQNRKTYKTFENVFLYKLLDECKVANPNHPYIFRLKEDKTAWFKKYYKEPKPAKDTKEYHIVRKGDTLWGLARKYKTTVKQLAEWNNIKNINLIRIGQKLRVK